MQKEFKMKFIKEKSKREANKQRLLNEIKNDEIDRKQRLMELDEEDQKWRERQEK